MEKQSDGYWMVTTPPLVPGLHYYSNPAHSDPQKAAERAF
jgi:hypothetical protein